MKNIGFNIKSLWVMAILSIIANFSLSAQVDAQLTQYFEIPNYYNPSAIGTTDFIKIRGDMRMQWL